MAAVSFDAQGRAPIVLLHATQWIPVLQQLGIAKKLRRHFSNQYSPSVFTPLVVVCRSVDPVERSTSLPLLGDRDSATR